MPNKLSRRQLLGLGAGAALSGAALGEVSLGRLLAQTPQNAVPAGLLPTRVLGQTGQSVSIFGLGGASSKTPLSNGPHEEAVKIVARALDLGVSYFDTATTYGDGKSETAIGEVAAKRRGEMFLATKSDARDYDGAMRELELSLKRLQTDHLDLWQQHRASLDERDTAPFFGPNGAHRALQKAKDEKMVRFVGVTGHHSAQVLGDWLKRFPFDTLLASVNAADVHQDDSFIKNLLPIASERRVGVIAMKVPAYGRLLSQDAGVGVGQLMHYALSQQGVSTCIIGCDSIEMLEENVAAARSITGPMSQQAQRALEAKTGEYWQKQRAGFYREWT